MMKNRVMVEGDIKRQPKRGDIIQYLNTEGGWEKVKLLTESPNTMDTSMYKMIKEKR